MIGACVQNQRRNADFRYALDIQLLYNITVGVVHTCCRALEYYTTVCSRPRGLARTLKHSCVVLGVSQYNAWVVLLETRHAALFPGFKEQQLVCLLLSVLNSTS